MIVSGLSVGHSIRQIAHNINRSASSISRELRRNCSDQGYDAFLAHHQAKAKRHKPRIIKKLKAHRHLRTYVMSKLDRLWSPQQISCRLIKDFPESKEMRISHETIYAYIYAMPKSGLRQELIANLRRKHPHRYKQGRAPNSDKGRISDMVSIHDRPEEIEGRQIMGHWEGDLIIGKNHGSAVGTLVERKSRYVFLAHLNKHTAKETRISFTRKLASVPQEIRKSITYDQGKEMSQHKMFSAELNMSVYFCDPRSPWQKGTVENTNGLIRQFLPKGSDLSDVSQDRLDEISHLLNTRPRKALDYQTPSEVYMKEFKLYHPDYNRCCT
jgi:IS30 family transposase